MAPNKEEGKNVPVRKRKMKEVQETSVALPPSGQMQMLPLPPSAPMQMLPLPPSGSSAAVQTGTPPLAGPSRLVQTPILPPNGPSSLQFPMQTQFFPPYLTMAPRPEFNNFQSPNALQDFNLKLYASLLAEDHVPDFLMPIIKEQNDQIDQMIIAHGERLKHTIASMQQKQFTSLLAAAGESVSQKLKEKEFEMAYLKRGWEQKESRARTELDYWKNKAIQATTSCLQSEVEHWKNQASQWEATTSSLQSEVDNWKSRASMAEATVRSLQSDVEFWKNKSGQWEAKASCLRSALHDAGIRGVEGVEGAGCSEAGEQARDHESSSHVEADGVEPVKMVCRVCGKRVATMMVWPCRHVCLCKKCDESAETCPVCQTTQGSSHEVYL